MTRSKVKMMTRGIFLPISDGVYSGKIKISWIDGYRFPEDNPFHKEIVEADMRIGTAKRSYVNGRTNTHMGEIYSFETLEDERKDAIISGVIGRLNERRSANFREDFFFW